MVITVNGSERLVADGISVRELIAELGAGTESLSADARGVAVAVDGDVVPRSAWEHTRLRAGGAVEVLVAVQGG